MEFTEEHIFPDSIGGKLKLNNVCKTCNSRLGTEVDSYLVNHFAIQLVKFALKIPSKNGELPNPFSEGHLKEDPAQKLYYKTDKEGNLVSLYTVTSKTETIEDGEEKISYIVDISDKDKLFGMINKTLRRKGYSEISRESIEQMLHVESITNPTMIIDFEMDLERYKRAIIKIAYELAYRWIGDAYLSDETGNILRLCLQDEEKDFSISEKYPNINMDIGPFGSIKWSDIVFSEMWKEDETNSHVALMVKKSGRIVCYIKIFKVFEGLVEVSMDAERYPDFKDMLVNNPVTGEPVDEVSCEEAEALLKNAGML